MENQEEEFLRFEQTESYNEGGRGYSLDDIADTQSQIMDTTESEPVLFSSEDNQAANANVAPAPKRPRIDPESGTSSSCDNQLEMSRLGISSQQHQQQQQQQQPQPSTSQVAIEEVPSSSSTTSSSIPSLPLTQKWVLSHPLTQKKFTFRKDASSQRLCLTSSAKNLLPYHQTQLGIRIDDVLKQWMVSTSSIDKLLEKILQEGMTTPFSRIVWAFLLGIEEYDIWEGTDNNGAATSTKSEILIEIITWGSNKRIEIMWRFIIGMLLIHHCKDMDMDLLARIKALATEKKVEDSYQTVINCIILYKVATLPIADGYRSTAFRKIEDKFLIDAIPMEVLKEMDDRLQDVRKERTKWILTILELFEENLLGLIFLPESTQYAFALAWSRKYFFNALYCNQNHLTPFTCVIQTYRLTRQTGCFRVIVAHSENKTLCTSILPEMWKSYGLLETDYKYDFLNLHKEDPVTIQRVFNILESYKGNGTTILITCRMLESLAEIGAVGTLEYIKDNEDTLKFSNYEARKLSKEILTRDEHEADKLATEISKQAKQLSPLQKQSRQEELQTMAAKTLHFNKKRFLMLLASKNLKIKEKEKLLLITQWICANEIKAPLKNPLNLINLPQNPTGNNFNDFFEYVAYTGGDLELLQMLRDLGSKQFITFEFFFRKTELPEATTLDD